MFLLFSVVSTGDSVLRFRAYSSLGRLYREVRSLRRAGAEEVLMSSNSFLICRGDGLSFVRGVVGED